MSTRDTMGNIQAFCDERQEECPDDIYHVHCHWCRRLVDPNVEPIHCWRVPGFDRDVLSCGDCDGAKLEVSNAP
jgi:hypothetical protein